MLAARDGVVVATEASYRVGGRSEELRSRANFVTIRHDDSCYSRYYHLCYGGVAVERGQRVAAGDIIGRSGNTGFSGCPHLHFDVVDVMPYETAELALLAPATADRADGGGHELVRREELRCIAGGISGELPVEDIPGHVVVADPPTACDDLRNAEAVRGCVALIDRCGEVDFIDKAQRAEAAGASAAVVVNLESCGSEIYGMAAPKSLPPDRPKSVGIPVVMVSHADGAALRAAAQRHAAGEVCAPRLSLRRSPHLVERAEEDAVRLIGRELQAHVPLTQPVRFVWPGRDGNRAYYVPKRGQMTPAAVQSGKKWQRAQERFTNSQIRAS